MEKNKIYCGNCVEILKDFPENSIDLTVTSPPYDLLRDYKGYSFPFEEIAQQLFRVTSERGMVIWIVGDQTVDGDESGTSFCQALYFKELGFKLHDTMIYEKHNFSNPSKTRYHQIFEYIFCLSKGTPRIFNPIKDRKNIEFGKSNWGKNTVRLKNGDLKERPKRIVAEYGMRRNIWKYVTGKQSLDAKLSYKHPAPFPYELAFDMIISWSNPDSLVLDPMCGSGTVLKAAKDLSRNYIGIDISLEYCALSQERLN